MKTEMATAETLKAEEAARTLLMVEKYEKDASKLRAEEDKIITEIQQANKLTLAHCQSKYFVYWLRQNIDQKSIDPSLADNTGLFLTQKEPEDHKPVSTQV